MAGFTPEQLAKLEQAIALGARSLEHNGKRTEFQSLTQMLALRDRMRNEIRTDLDPDNPVPCMTRPTFYRRA